MLPEQFNEMVDDIVSRGGEHFRVFKESTVRRALPIFTVIVSRCVCGWFDYFSSLESVRNTALSFVGSLRHA